MLAGGGAWGGQALRLRVAAEGQGGSADREVAQLDGRGIQGGNGREVDAVGPVAQGVAGAAVEDRPGDADPVQGRERAGHRRAGDREVRLEERLGGKGQIVRDDAVAAISEVNAVVVDRLRVQPGQGRLVRPIGDVADR